MSGSASRGKRKYNKVKPLKGRRYLRPFSYYLNLSLEEFAPKFGYILAYVLAFIIIIIILCLTTSIEETKSILLNLVKTQLSTILQQEF